MSDGFILQSSYDPFDESTVPSILEEESPQVFDGRTQFQVKVKLYLGPSQYTVLKEQGKEYVL